MTMRRLENRLGELERSVALPTARTLEVEPYEDLVELLEDELGGDLRTWVRRRLMLIVDQAQRSRELATALRALQTLSALECGPMNGVAGTDAAPDDYAQVVRAIERVERERARPTRAPERGHPSELHG